MFVSISTYRKTEKFAILGKDKNNGLLFKHTALRYDGSYSRSIVLPRKYVTFVR